MSAGEQIEAVYNDFAFDNRLLARAREAEFARDLERDLGYDVPPRNKGISNRAKNRRIALAQGAFAIRRAQSNGGSLTKTPSRYRTIVQSRVHDSDLTGWIVANPGHPKIPDAIGRLFKLLSEDDERVGRTKKPCP